MVSPLSTVAIGLALVAVDFRTEALDLLPDPLGWAVVALGAWRLAVRAAAIAAALAGALSFSDVWLNYRYVVLDPFTYQPVEECPVPAGCPVRIEYLLVGAGQAALIALATMVGGVAIVLIVRRLAEIPIESARDPFIQRYARLAALLIPIAWVAPFVGVVAADSLADGRYQPFWDGGQAFVSPILMLGLLAVAAFLLRTSALLGRSLRQDHDDSDRLGWLR